MPPDERSSQSAKRSSLPVIAPNLLAEIGERGFVVWRHLRQSDRWLNLRSTRETVGGRVPPTPAHGNARGSALCIPGRRMGWDWSHASI